MAKKLPEKKLHEKLSKIIADIGMTEEEATWDVHGTPVVLHKACEKIALKNHRNRFSSLLKKGFLIDFKYRVVFNGYIERKQIIAINQIVNLNPVKIVYDINFDR